MHAPLLRCLLALCFVPLVVLDGSAWAEDEGANPKAGEHEELRQRLVKAWLAQRDVNLRYEMASDSKDPELAGKVISLDLRIIGRAHAIRITSNEANSDTADVLTMALDGSMLMLHYGEAEPIATWGWSFQEARRLRVAKAWQRARASLDLPDPHVDEAPFGPHVQLAADPTDDGSVRGQFGLTSAVGPFVPNWLSQEEWTGRRTSLLEDERTLELASPGRRVRIDRRTGALIEIEQRRAADNSTTWVRSVPPALTREAWASIIRAWPSGEDVPRSDRLELLFRVGPLLHLESYLATLTRTQRGHGALVRLLIQPVVDAACNDPVHADDLLWAVPETLNAVRRMRADHPEKDGERTASLLTRTAAKFAEPTLKVLESNRAKITEPQGGDAAARARVEKAVRAFWRHALTQAMNREDQRRVLAQQFNTLDSTIFKYSWRCTPTDKSVDPRGGSFTLWTEQGTVGARWLDSAKRPCATYLSPTRTVMARPATDEPIIAPGHEAWSRRHARLARVATSLKRGLSLDSIRRIVPRFDVSFEPMAGGSAPWAEAELGFDPAPTWLNPGVWGPDLATEIKDRVVVLAGDSMRMRIERASGVILGMDYEPSVGKVSLQLEARRPGDDDMAIWASAWERMPYSMTGLRWTYEEVLAQITDLLVLVCDGQLAKSPEARRNEVASAAARAAFDDEILMGRLADYVRRETQMLRTYYAEAKATRPDLEHARVARHWASKRGPLYATRMTKDHLARTRDSLALNPEATYDSELADAIVAALAAIITERLVPLLDAALEAEPR